MYCYLLTLLQLPLLSRLTISGRELRTRARAGWDEKAFGQLFIHAWMYYGLAHHSVYLDMGFETLNLKFCESRL